MIGLNFKCRKITPVFGVLVLCLTLPVQAQDLTRLEGLQKAQVAMIEFVRARNAQGIGELFMAEGIMVLGNGDHLVGPDEIQAYWTENWAENDGPNPYREYHTGVISSGKLVMDGGGFGPESMEEPVGEFARVWERNESGDWRIRMYIISPP